MDQPLPAALRWAQPKTLQTTPRRTHRELGRWTTTPDWTGTATARLTTSHPAKAAQAWGFPTPGLETRRVKQARSCGTGEAGESHLLARPSWQNQQGVGREPHGQAAQTPTSTRHPTWKRLSLPTRPETPPRQPAQGEPSGGPPRRQAAGDTLSEVWGSLPQHAPGLDTPRPRGENPTLPRGTRQSAPGAALRLREQQQQGQGPWEPQAHRRGSGDTLALGPQSRWSAGTCTLSLSGQTAHPDKRRASGTESP